MNQGMNESGRRGSQSGTGIGAGTGWAQGALWKLWMAGSAPRAANTASAASAAPADADDSGSIYLPDAAVADAVLRIASKGAFGVDRAATAAVLTPAAAPGADRSNPGDRPVSRDAAQWGAALLDQLGIAGRR